MVHITPPINEAISKLFCDVDWWGDEVPSERALDIALEHEASDAHIEAGGFDCNADRVADRVIALLDGLGLRALLGDPAMPVVRAREEVWDAVARELRLDAAAPTG